MEAKISFFIEFQICFFFIQAKMKKLNGSPFKRAVIMLCLFSIHVHKTDKLRNISNFFAENIDCSRMLIYFKNYSERCEKVQR